MSELISDHHYCWTKKCNKCGLMNGGCVRFKVFCYNCKEPLILFDTYPQSDLTDIFVSPEAMLQIKNWGENNE